ncbi:C25 family cysteine peptidase, partial [Acidobacteriota bacterium]
RFFRIYHRENEIAIMVFGEDDGAFSGTDRLMFYGQKNEEMWTETSVYWLVLEDIRQGYGKRMNRVTAIPEGVDGFEVVSRWHKPVHLENQDMIWFMDTNIPGRDCWYYEKRLIADSGYPEDWWTHEINFTVPDFFQPLPGEYCHLRGRVASTYFGGNIDPDCRVELSLNNTPVGNTNWTLTQRTSRTEHYFDFQFPADLLSDTMNTLKIQQPPNPSSGKMRTTFLDYFDVYHPQPLHAKANKFAFSGLKTGKVLYAAGNFATPNLKVFRIIDPDEPEIIEAFLTSTIGPGMPVSIFVPVEDSQGENEQIIVAPWQGEDPPAAIRLDSMSDLRNVQNSADYLIITHKDFALPAQALGDYRSAQNGYDVFLADIEDIYDEFSAGNVDPQAIKDFLYYVFYNWNKAPTFVLLVGDSSYDYKDQYGYWRPGYEQTFFVPSMHYFMIDPALRRASADSLFVQITGDDHFPEYLIGRIPVRTEDQMWDQYNKIVEYEASDINGTWPGRFVFLADDDLQNWMYCDPPGVADTFFNEQIIAPYLSQADQSGDVVRIYVDYADDPDMDGNYGEHIREDLYNELNQGAAIYSYYGHAGTILLGTHCEDNGEGPPFMDITDEPLLTNVGKYPFGAITTCHVGDFEYVRYHYSPYDALFYHSLAEAMFVPQDTGFIGWMAGTADVPLMGGEYVLAGFYDALADPNSAYVPPFIQPDERTTAGALMWAGQLRLYEHLGDGIPHTDPPGKGGAKDTILTNVVLGDPALRLKARTW